MEADEEHPHKASYRQELYILPCCICGITFAMPAAYESRRRDDHQQFHCPNGHPQGFFLEKSKPELKAEVERLSKEVAELKTANIRLQAALDQAEAKNLSGGSNDAEPRQG